MSSSLEHVVSAKSSWDAGTIETFLHEARQPLRLATINSAGFPQITSLWFVFDGGALWCCTQRTALVARQIERERRVGFEVAVNDPPYFGMSGYGNAEVLREDATGLLDTLTSRHLSSADAQLKRWLMSRVDSEVIIKVVPEHVTSWDFRGRMAQAI